MTKTDDNFPSDKILADTYRESQEEKNTKLHKSKKKSPVGLYDVNDLANAARLRFNTAPELVTAALREAGKEKLTLDEAEIIIKNFMIREVK